MRILVLNTLLTFGGQYNWCECGSYFAGGVDGDETCDLLRTTHFEQQMHHASQKQGEHDYTFPNVISSSDIMSARRNSPGPCTVRTGGSRLDGCCTGVASWTNAVSGKSFGQTTHSTESNKTKTVKPGILVHEQKNTGDNMKEPIFSSEKTKQQ